MVIAIKDKEEDSSTLKSKLQKALLARLNVEKSKQNVVSLNQQVSVTYHKMDLFMEMFPDSFGENLVQFRESLNPKANRDMVFKAGEGAGRSGSFFFFSHDRKFIIKTMTKAELKLYLAKLPEFSKHFQANDNSLIARIYGVFTVNTEYMKKVHVMLMENTLQLRNPDGLEKVFDLKGSYVDRLTKGPITPSSTLKDTNFLSWRLRDCMSFSPL